jgi:quinol monooxygenase YgiN
MVVQIVVVSVRPEQRERWLEVLRMNATQTRAEDGCESYRIAEDLETPNRFLIVEQWATMEAQYNHFRNPQFAQLMGSLGDLIAEPPDVSIHEVTSTMTLDEVLAAAGVAR